MRRRSKDGGGRAKMRRRRATPPKQHSEPKAPRRPTASSNRETEVARLRRELMEAQKQQAATSEVLQLISSSARDLETIFAAILEKAVAICDADFGNIYQWDHEVLQLVASHNAPPAFTEYRRRSPVAPISSPSASVPGRMTANRTPMQIADLAKDQVLSRSEPPNCCGRRTWGYPHPCRSSDDQGRQVYRFD
jgi:hypothetical protein